MRGGEAVCVGGRKCERGYFGDSLISGFITPIAC